MRYDTRDFDRYSPRSRGGRRMHGGPGSGLQFGNWGARSGLEQSTPRGRTAAYDGGYSREPRAWRAEGGHPRGYDHGWGMARMHNQIMHGAGAAFDETRDYNRSHPIHPYDADIAPPRFGPRRSRPGAGEGRVYRR